MRYAYYPGCSLKSSAAEYETSLLAMCQALDIELAEVPDWNCCGATPAYTVDPLLGVGLSARNLVWAEDEGLDVMMPCLGCLKNARKAVLKLHDNSYRQATQEALGREFRNSVRVVHPIEILYVDLGLDVLEKRVTRPLTGLKIAPYYGCYLTRPTCDFDSPENPQSLEQFIAALGGEPVQFSHKMKCCGGGIFLTQEDAALDLCHRILTRARAEGADCILVTCPLCDMLLDSYQVKINPRFKVKHNMPILYFSQLAGLAFGMDSKDKALGLGRRVVSVQPVLDRLAQEEARLERQAQQQE
ncbi:MAG: CoB--CoM heterodisulfide reductase iron-sulfur subunit B family protein [Chloroflexi bacterium]|nr:CoB--CoM heterodisulfide reductase iron-sulfur subunit B family protein [Chloroflexota bacterium]MBU1750762.1 CoB--CoM heterodisulfide reductase iron-sulfur subunit B family protein [Chloroflexota bacterium]